MGGAKVSAVLQISVFGPSAVAPWGASTAFFSINSARYSLIASCGPSCNVCRRQVSLIDIFVNVSFGHVPPYKAKLLFYVSEPSPRDCQRPGIA